MEEITLTIDGREAKGRRGDTILAVCQRNHIDVPTLCHYKGLLDIGACRLCVVEIEGARALNTACTTPATSGMVVRTDTPTLNALRKSTLELLFAERNHHCMFCEMSANCELQALGYRYGVDSVRYPYMHPALEVDSTNPYFVFDQNRCVLCRRCVRACSELVGVSTLGYKERGASTTIATDLDEPLKDSTCISCGTCVQVCPTGALIDRRSAYKAGGEKFDQVKSSCQECGVGCQIEGVVRARHVVRVDGDLEGAPNYGMLCVKGRYESLNGAKARHLKPMVRREGKLVEASWDEALDTVAQRLSAAKKARGAGGVVALTTSEATNEALYLMEWIFRGGLGAKFGVIGATEADNRAKALKRTVGGGFNAEARFGSIGAADFILMLGADPATTHPVIASLIRRKSALGTASLALVGESTNALAPNACMVVTPEPGSEGILVNGIMQALLSEGLVKAPAGENGQGNANWDQALSVLAQSLQAYTPRVVAQATGVPADDILQIARALGGAFNPIVVYGGNMLASEDRAASAISLALLLGADAGGHARAIGLTQGTNSLASARLLGSKGVEAAEGAVAAFVALGDEPPGELAEKLGRLEFLAVQAAYPSTLTDKADVVLPALTWAERGGTFVASDGSGRTVRKLVAAPAGMKSDLEVLATLGSKLGAAASFAESELAAKIEQALLTPAADLNRAAPVCVEYL